MKPLGISYRPNCHKRLSDRACGIVEAQPEETWEGPEEVLKTALGLGLDQLEIVAGIPTPNQLSGGD